jgi:hypothetical protein
MPKLYNMVRNEVIALEMDNSLREAMMQMVNLQAQQLNVMNQMNSNIQMSSSGAFAPNASVLTSYTNYAAPYQGPPNPFAPPPQAAAQFQSYASQIAPGGIKNALREYINTPSGQISPEQKSIMAANLSGNLTNTAIAGGGAVLGGIGQFGSMMIPGVGLLGSIGLGAVAGGITGAATAVALDQAQQNQAYNKYLLQNSYRFINPLESNNERGVGGFSLREREDMGNWMRKFDVKGNITDKQTMDLLQSFTEGDLMKSASDLDSFQKKFGQMVEITKKAALTFNTSLKQAGDLIGDMEKRGILSQNFDYFASLAKGVGSFTGQSADQAFNSIYNISNSMVGQGSTTDREAAMVSAGKYKKLIDQQYEVSKASDGRLYRYISSFPDMDTAIQQTTSTVSSGIQKSSDYYAILYAGAGLDKSGATGSSLESFLANTKGKSISEITSLAERNLDELRKNQGWSTIQLKEYYDSYKDQLYENPLDFMSSITAGKAKYNNTTFSAQANLDFGPDAGMILDAYNSANTPANIAALTAAAKRQDILSGLTVKNVGFRDTLRNLGAGVLNWAGDAIDPIQRETNQISQIWGDFWAGGSITVATLSDADYTTRQNLQSIDNIEESERELNVGNATPDKNSTLSYRKDGIRQDKTISQTIKEIKNRMSGLGKNSDKYKKYESLLGQYDVSIKQAKGMVDTGNILMSGMNWWEKQQFKILYKNSDWEGMTTSEIRAQEKAITKYLVDKVDDLGGDKKAVNRFLNATDFAGATGISQEEWASRFISAGTDNKKITTVVEQIMTEMNKKSTVPLSGNEKSKNPGLESDATVNANQVIIYAGSTINNSNARNDGGGESSIFSGITPSSTPKKFWR